MGTENLLLAAALLLLTTFHFNGGLYRYISALILLALIPFIKLTGGVVALGAILGFLGHRAIWCGCRRALREAAAAAVVIGLAGVVICALSFPSLDAFGKYIRSSLNLISSYSVAMSDPGSNLELVAALAALSIFCVLLSKLKSAASKWFYVFLLILPIGASMKHAFVRQGVGLHGINFFCFVAVAMALVCLNLPTGRRAAIAALVCLGLYIPIWRYEVTYPLGGVKMVLPMSTGQRAVSLAAQILPFNDLRARLDAADAGYPIEARTEPGIRAMIGDSTVASLSVGYNSAAVEGLHLALYPIVQRYQACTPFLDRENATWVGDRGPAFFLFDGLAIDGRHFWMESPAMWMEIYRWYDLASMGSRSILLRRRSAPRFSHLRPIGRSHFLLSDQLHIPTADMPVFWRMKCELSLRGSVQKLLWRIAPVTASVVERNKDLGAFRIIPEVLDSPVMGNFMPSSLSELALAFRSSGTPDYLVRSLSFGGPGISSYENGCELEFLEPAL